MLWRNSPVYLYLFYVTGLHDPVVRTKMSRLSVGLYWRYHDVSRYQKFRHWWLVYHV